MLTRPLLRRPRRSTFDQTPAIRESFTKSRDSTIVIPECIQYQKLLDFTEQQEKKKEKTASHTYTFTLNPDEKLMICWQILVLLCILIYFIELPIALTFTTQYRKEDTKFLFQIINFPSIVIFFINIIVRFRTAYYQSGILIQDPNKIASHYLKFYFIFDIVALFSISSGEITEIARDDTITEDSTQIYIKYTSLLFYLMIVELVLIERSVIRSLQLHRRLKACFSLIMLIFYILFISNAYACIFFSISRSYKTNYGSSVDVPTCWIDSVSPQGIPVSQQTWIVQYLYSLYWASTTMLTVGYGDVTPKNRYEVLFDIIAEFTSCLVFAYSVNKIWEIRMELQEKREKYQKKYNIINRFMRDKSIKSEIRSRVNAYLAHFYKHEKLRDAELENEVIRELAPGLRDELYMDTYGFIFKEFQVFKPFSEDLFTELVYKIQEVRYSEYEIIFEPGGQEIDFRLCYLCKGSVEYYIQMPHKKYMIRNIQTQEIFGRYQFFTGLCSDTTMSAHAYCLVYALKMSDWKTTIKNYWDDFQKYCEMRDYAQFLHDLKPLKISCRLCSSFKHPTEQCAQSEINSWKVAQIRSYKNSENSHRSKLWQRRRYKSINVLSKDFIQDLQLMQDFVINRGSMSYFKSSVNILKDDRSIDSAEEHRSQQLDMIEESLDDIREPQFVKIKKLNSMKMSLNRPSSLNIKNRTERHKSTLVPRFQKPKFVPQVIEIEEEHKEVVESIEIDQKCSYEFYFRNMNVQNVVNSQKRSYPRRDTKRMSVAFDNSQ